MNWRFTRILVAAACFVLIPIISSGVAFAYCPSYSQDEYYDCSMVPEYWACWDWCAQAECWPSNGYGPPAVDGICTTGDYHCSFVFWIYGGGCGY